MYYVGNHQGFLTWIDDYDGYDPHAVHSQPDVRYAHPFETFEQADSAAKEYGGGKPYAILSTLGEAPQQPYPSQATPPTETIGLRYITQEHVKVHRADYLDKTHEYAALTLVITDALANTYTWPAFVVVRHEADGYFSADVLAFNGQVAMPRDLPAHSYFGASRYLKTVLPANIAAAAKNKSTIHIVLGPPKPQQVPA